MRALTCAKSDGDVASLVGSTSEPSAFTSQFLTGTLTVIEVGVLSVTTSGVENCTSLLASTAIVSSNAVPSKVPLSSTRDTRSSNSRNVPAGIVLAGSVTSVVSSGRLTLNGPSLSSPHAAVLGAAAG